MAVCAASIALLVVACNGSPTSAGEGACGFPGSSSFQTEWDIQISGGVQVRGNKAVWVAEDGWIGLGPEVVDSLDAVAVVGLTIDTPHTFKRDESGNPLCTAAILGATISTSRQAVGTADQVDARLYEYIPPSNTLPFLTISGVGQGVIQGSGSLDVSRVIIRPTEPPRFGESVKVGIGFSARAP